MKPLEEMWPHTHSPKSTQTAHRAASCTWSHVCGEAASLSCSSNRAAPKRTAARGTVVTSPAPCPRKLSVYPPVPYT
eukprot:2613691-Prymnesium_polylepis.1